MATSISSIATKTLTDPENWVTASNTIDSVWKSVHDFQSGITIDQHTFEADTLGQLLDILFRQHSELQI